MTFDDVAAVYDETRIVPNWVLNEFYERTLKKETRSNPNLVILDAGIGTGRTIGSLLNLDINLVGIDISKKMLRKMVERVKEKPVWNRVNLILGDVTNLPFRTCSFDIVMSVHVLHLLKKWKQAILETKRVLKPKGSFITAGHNAPELENEIGKKYLDLFLKRFRKRSRIHAMPIARKVFEYKKMKFLNRVLEKVMEYNSWESYLKRKASSTKMCAIIWKETVSIPVIVDRLNKRFLYLKKGISTETFEEIKFELAKWKIEKMKKSPFLEIRRTFGFNVSKF